MNGLRKFSARQRIRKKADFANVRSLGIRIHGGAFILQAVRRPDSESAQPRLGVITSRRVGSAVRRNRARRLMREVFRNNQEQIPPHTDLVIVMRHTFVRESYTSLEERFRKACARLQSVFTENAATEEAGR